MINTFEEYTFELTEYERETLQPIIIKGLKARIGKENSITNKKICKALKDLRHDITEPRLRKIIHNIRANNIIPLLLSTSKGYFVAKDNKEVEDWIKSMEQRINSQKQILNAIKNQKYKKATTPAPTTLFWDQDKKVNDL